MSSRRVPYAGIVTRAVGLVIDIALAQLAWTLGVATLTLVASLVGELRPSWLVGALVAVAWILVVGTYFVLFWSISGQTPGMRCMHVRVVDKNGKPPSFGRALVRFVGLILAIIPLFLGFLPVLVDDRRRALQDFLAGTVVLYAEPEEEPAPRLSTAGVSSS